MESEEIDPGEEEGRHPRQSIYEGRLESDTGRGTPEGGDAEVQCGCAGLEGVRERSGEKGLGVIMIGRGQMAGSLEQ